MELNELNRSGSLTGYIGALYLSTVSLGIEVLSSQGGMKSSAFTDSSLFYSGQLIGSVSFFSSTICVFFSCHPFPSLCPPFSYVLHEDTCIQMKPVFVCVFFFVSGVS